MSLVQVFMTWLLFHPFCVGGFHPFCVSCWRWLYVCACSPAGSDSAVNFGCRWICGLQWKDTGGRWGGVSWWPTDYLNMSDPVVPRWMDSQLRTEEAVWEGQQWCRMSLSCVQYLWHQLHPRVWDSDRVLLLWEWESWYNIYWCTICKWPTLGWWELWILSLLWAELPTWDNCPLVLQAAPPSCNWQYWSSYLWGCMYFKWRHSSWTYWIVHSLN